MSELNHPYGEYLKSEYFSQPHSRNLLSLPLESPEGHKNYRSDFLANGVYIEVWGIDNDEDYLNRRNSKTAIYQRNNLPYN